MSEGKRVSQWINGTNAVRTRLDSCVSSVSTYLLPDTLDLLFADFVDALENVDKEAAEDVKDLVVVLVESHLHVHPGELAEVPRGVVLLCPEHRANLKASFESAARRHHLLVELRGLREADILDCDCDNKIEEGREGCEHSQSVRRTKDSLKKETTHRRQNKDEKNIERNSPVQSSPI